MQPPSKSQRNVLRLVAAVLGTMIVPLWAPHVRADHASIHLGVGKAAPLNTESGATLPKGTWSTGIRTEYVDFAEFSDAELTELGEKDAEADLHSVGSLLTVSAGLFYGVTDDLTVGLRVPYVRRTDIREPEHGHEHDGDEVAHEHGAAAIEELGDAEDIGDLTVIGHYRFFEVPDKHDVAALVGLKTPTGTTNDKADAGFRLETELQPGSGSWDPLLGLAYTYSFSPFVLDSNVLYTFVTEGAQDTDLGDIFDYNLSIAYRLASRYGARPHHHHDHHDPGGEDREPLFSWDLILELNGEWRDKLEIDGDTNANSGGNLIYLSPGLRLGLPHGLSLGASVGVPIVTDLNGDQVEPDYRIITTLAAAF